MKPTRVKDGMAQAHERTLQDDNPKTKKRPDIRISERYGDDVASTPIAFSLYVLVPQQRDGTRKDP